MCPARGDLWWSGGVVAKAPRHHESAGRIMTTGAQAWLWTYDRAPYTEEPLDHGPRLELHWCKRCGCVYAVEA